jgi:hypothetical protein
MRTTESALIGVLGQQQVMLSFDYPLGSAPCGGYWTPQDLRHPRFDLQRGRRIFVSIPDQVLHSEPGSSQDQFRIMNQHHVVILRKRQYHRAGCLPASDAAPAHSLDTFRSPEGRSARTMKLRGLPNSDSLVQILS